MFVPFETLPGNARLWIYQADRDLTRAETNELSEQLRKFCETWQAHGQPLKTSFRIEQNRFVILAVDVTYNDTSGCSIDGSVRILKALQQESQIDFFNRTLIAFVDGEKVRTFPMSKLKDLFAEGILNATSQTVNTLVATKSAFDREWIQPVAHSWLKKYLPKSAVAGS